MVAATGPKSPTPYRNVEVPPSSLAGRGSLVRFTVDDVLSMMRQGIVPEGATTELLRGFLVLKDRSDLGGDPLMHGTRHRACVRRLTSLAGRIETATRFAQIQCPIICGSNEMSEPDFALIRGTDADYATRLPTASDVIVIIEAADSSYERDSGEKLETYAFAGIPQYAIVNLRNSTIEEYGDVDSAAGAYRQKAIYSRDQTVILRGGINGNIPLLVADVLP